MKIKNSNQYGNTNIEAVEQFEKNLGISIPKEYKDFLLEHNGGEPEPSYFDLNDDIIKIHGDFYGLHEGPEYYRLDNICSYFDPLKDNGLFPITGSETGDTICIATKNNNKVVFLDYHTHDITVISNSFSEFFQKLKDYDFDTDLEKILKSDDLLALKKLLDNGLDPHSLDEYNRNLLENAAIHNSLKIIEFLHQEGISLRESLSLAKKNARFFKEHLASVKLLEKFTSS